MFNRGTKGRVQAFLGLLNNHHLAYWPLAFHPWDSAA